jgi:hypothetical protein
MPDTYSQAIEKRIKYTGLKKNQSFCKTKINDK